MITITEGCVFPFGILVGMLVLALACTHLSNENLISANTYWQHDGQQENQQDPMNLSPVLPHEPCPSGSLD